MAQQIATYTKGFHLKFTKSITRKEFIIICKTLNSKPEQITGGGLLQMDNEHGYKTIRFHLDHFPWVSSTIMNEWENDETTLICNGTILYTTLKAFEGAPAWTVQELQHYKEVFEHFGINCKKMPSARSLIYV